MLESLQSCIDCSSLGCSECGKKYPAFCLTAKLPDEDLCRSVELMKDSKYTSYLEAAAEVIKIGKGHITRVEETILFAKQLHAHKIGIATCTALIAESRILAKIFRANGFSVYGVSCKVGAVPRAELGLGPEYCILGPNTCNPILQAHLLNEARTELNVVMGLCVGHDMIFQKHSEAMCTTLVAKDRVTGHNPVVPIYNVNTSYKYLLDPHWLETL